ncbi:hypothetical protein ACLOJK_035287 [Asimina triloba]
MEFSFGKKPTRFQKIPVVVLLLTVILLLLAIIPLCYPLIRPSFLWKFFALSSTTSSLDHRSIELVGRDGDQCDLFIGEWVPNPDSPYYTNITCWAIHDHQNCMKYGRPDMNFLKWRWKPDGCELPIFDPAEFLEFLRGKSLAFVGDSVGRNQMQSLICLLSGVTVGWPLGVSKMYHVIKLTLVAPTATIRKQNSPFQVEYPIDVSYTTDEKFKRWLYTSYNFTIANYWSPFLVRSKQADNGPIDMGIFNLFLDEFDEDWTTHIDGFDYVIISAGHWFFRPTMFYEDGQIVGCHYCQRKNVTDLTLYYSYRKAFRTAFRAINSLKNFKGTTFLRTFAPSHFENGLWDEGGNCLRTKPFKSNETTLEGQNFELHMIQVEEFGTARDEGWERGLKFKLLDTTQAMLLRPDGHPSRYGHRPEENVTLYNDCVHWCLPGPIDTWNDFLLEMLKMERIESSNKELSKISKKLMHGALERRLRRFPRGENRVDDRREMALVLREITSLPLFALPVVLPHIKSINKNAERERAVIPHLKKKGGEEEGEERDGGTLQSWMKGHGLALSLKDQHPSRCHRQSQQRHDFKGMDIAIVKATNHVECPLKECHLRSESCSSLTPCFPIFSFLDFYSVLFLF